ncbi:phosphohistidine phosphatase SixA [Marinobacteraceae bacterium S3BR75-40.1]
MRLIIMRHGEAGPHRSDFERSLTSTGVAASQRVAEQLKGLPWKADRVWVSPLVRAQQTAETVVAAWPSLLETKPFLTPDDDPAACMDALQALPDSETVLLVSHMPFVGVFTSLLVEGHRRGMPFMTSQALILEMPVAAPGCAELKQHILP